MLVGLVTVAFAGPVQQPVPRAAELPAAAPGPTERLEARCGAGDDLACLRAADAVLGASAWDPTRWRALRIAEIERQPIERLVGRTASLADLCDAGVARACADLAFYVQAGAGLPADPDRAEVLRARARAAAELGCARGDLPACRYAVRVDDLVVAGFVYRPPR